MNPFKIIKDIFSDINELKERIDDRPTFQQLNVIDDRLDKIEYYINALIDYLDIELIEEYKESNINSRRTISTQNIKKRFQKRK